jgi:hypothetical protein
MRIIYCLFLSLALHVAAPTAAAQSLNSLRAEILEYGLFSIHGETVDTDRPSTAAGRTTEHEESRHIRRADRFAARKGITFGFRYRLRWEREGDLHGLEMHVIHPAMRGKDGRTHLTTTAPTDAFFENGVSDGEILYSLSEDFEVLPGEWTLEIHLDGKPILSKRFTLSK